MSDYADILYLITAMVVFSIISINASVMFRNSSMALMRSEIEYNAISVLQDEVEEVRWLSNDEQAQIDSTIGSTYRYENPITKTRSIDGDPIEYTLNGTYDQVNFPDLGIDSYKIKLTVNSPYLFKGQRVTQTIIKNFAN